MAVIVFFVHLQRCSLTTGCFDSGSNSVELASRMVQKYKNHMNMMINIAPPKKGNPFIHQHCQS